MCAISPFPWSGQTVSYELGPTLWNSLKNSSVAICSALAETPSNAVLSPQAAQGWMSCAYTLKFLIAAWMVTVPPPLNGSATTLPVPSLLASSRAPMRACGRRAHHLNRDTGGQCPSLFPTSRRVARDTLVQSTRSRNRDKGLLSYCF